MISNYGRFGFWSPMSTISSGASALSAWAFGEEEEVAAPLSASSGSQSTQPLPSAPTGTTGSQSTSATAKPKPKPQASTPSNVPPGAGPAAPSGGIPLWVWVASAGIVGGAYLASKR